MSESVKSYFLIERYGINRRTLSDWALESDSRIGDDEFDLTKIDTFVVTKYRDDLKKLKGQRNTSANRDRLYIANCEFRETETALKKLDLAQREGLLIPLETLITTLTSNNTAIRVKLQSFPDRFALEFSGIDSPVEMRDRIDEVVRETLENLNTEYERGIDDE